MASSGSVTQTLSVITQASEGYQLYNAQLHDVAAATGAPTEFAEETLISYMDAGSSITAIEIYNLVGTATADNTLEFDVFTFLTETANASEAYQVEQTSTLSYTAVASEAIYQSISLLFSNTFNASSTFDTSIITELHETATVAGTTEMQGLLYQTVTATANATDWIYTGGAVDYTDTFTATDDITPYAVIIETETSAATATDTQEYWVSALEYLSASADASNSFSFEGAILNYTLEATAVVSDWLWAKDFEAIAWVLNTKSGGIWNYNNFGFTSLAFHAGSLYATSPEGLFLLDAEDDDGRSISSVTTSGYLDFGVNEKKRISDVYIGYTGGDLECDVETYDTLPYTYEMEYRDADAPHNSRIKTGRGLSSRYWRFTFRNIGGADFQIQDVAVNLATSNRRV